LNHWNGFTAARLHEATNVASTAAAVAVHGLPGALLNVGF
jgi:hypothetical protein